MKLGGWWRAWIAVTVLWLIVSAAWYGILGPTNSADLYRTARIQIYCSITMQDGLQDYSYSTPDTLRRLVSKLDPNGIAAYQMKQCIDAKELDDSSEYAANVREQAFAFLAIFVVPPLAILSLGCAAGWVLRGFRSKQ